jgi:polypeptide N-acetylgalactosaminyltransferase
MGRGVGQEVGLYGCAANRTFPHSTQYFSLGFFRDIRKHFDSGICFDSGRPKANHVSIIYTSGCHWNQGRQYFHYDLTSQTIRYGNDEKFCLEADGNQRTVFVSSCKRNYNNQKWKFGYHNVNALKNWTKVGVKIQ